MKSNTLIIKWRIPLLLGLIFVFTEFGGAINLGFISIRNIAVIFMATYLICHRNINKNTFLVSSVLIYYYVFVAFLGLFNDLYSSAGINLIFARFIPTLVVLFFMTSYVKKCIHYKRFIFVLLFIIILDSLATILQGINHPIGWQIASIFQSADELDSSMDAIMKRGASTTMGLSIASGFCGSVVGNGYMLGSLGLLYITPYIFNPNFKNLLVSLSCFLCIFVALIFNQQRLAFYVFTIISSCMFFLFAYKKHSLTMLLLVVVSAFMIYYYYSQPLISDYDFGRLENFEDEEREMRQEIFWNDFFYKNCLLGNRSLYVTLYGSTPHNLFIETILLGGIIGCIIMIVFLFKVSYRVFNDFIKDNIISFFLGLPTISLILISLKHSSGFHTGTTICAYTLILLILSKFLTPQNNISNKK